MFFLFKPSSGRCLCVGARLPMGLYNLFRSWILGDMGSISYESQAVDKQEHWMRITGLPYLYFIHPYFFYLHFPFLVKRFQCFCALSTSWIWRCSWLLQAILKRDCEDWRWGLKSWVGAFFSLALEGKITSRLPAWSKGWSGRGCQKWKREPGTLFFFPLMWDWLLSELHLIDETFRTLELCGKIFHFSYTTAVSPSAREYWLYSVNLL